MEIKIVKTNNDGSLEISTSELQTLTIDELRNRLHGIDYEKESLVRESGRIKERYDKLTLEAEQIKKIIDKVGGENKLEVL